MRPATKTVAEGDHVAAATYLMRHASATSLVVTDVQAGKPVAIITAADITRAVSEGKDPNEIHIHDLLTTRPAPISAAAPVRDAAEAMLTAGLRQLPVIGDGDSIGIVDIADIARAAEVLNAWREWTATVPDEVTSIGHILRFPPLPEVPEPFRGHAFVIVEAAYLGDADAGAELTGPLRRLGPELDTFARIPAPALDQLNMDPDQPVPGQGDGAFLTDLPAAAIDALLTLTGPDADTPLGTVEVRHLGGALARPAPGGGAQPSIDANYLMYAGGLTPTPDLAAVVRAQAQAVKDTLTPWHAGYDYYNFEESPTAASAVLPPASYHRLQEIKAAHDPGQVIISAHPV